MLASLIEEVFTYQRIEGKRSISHKIIEVGMSLMGCRIPPKPDLSTTDVDYKGVVYGTQLAIHFMRQNPQPGGAIMATASVCAYHPIESLPEYSGAKAAVN